MFGSFQNDTGTLNLNTRDAYGTLTVSATYAVDCDVQFKRREVNNREGNKITTNAEVYATPTASLNAVSLSDFVTKTWTFTYESVVYEVESVTRVRVPAKDVIDHYKILLR